jgi:hypothetical protein
MTRRMVAQGTDVRLPPATGKIPRNREKITRLLAERLWLRTQGTTLRLVPSALTHTNPTRAPGICERSTSRRPNPRSRFGLVFRCPPTAVAIGEESRKIKWDRDKMVRGRYHHDRVEGSS